MTRIIENCGIALNQFPPLLSSYMTMVHLSKLRNQHWYVTLFRLQTFSVSPLFPWMSSLYFRIHSGYHIVSSYHISPGTSGLWEFLSLSLFPCQIWGILARDCIEYPLIWIRLIFPSWLHWNYGVLERISQRLRDIIM